MRGAPETPDKLSVLFGLTLLTGYVLYLKFWLGRRRAAVAAQQNQPQSS